MVAIEQMHDIAGRLLTYLRIKLDYSGTEFISAPESLLGGFETELYRFELANIPDELTGPLVLRIFPADVTPKRAVWEHAVMNGLLEAGVRVPRTLLSETDLSVFGAPFLVMQFVQGQTLFDGEPERAPYILGRTQAALHDLDPSSIMRSLCQQGVTADWFRFEQRLERLYGRRAVHPWLSETLQWLVDNKPVVTDETVICHGDFHPFNVLVANGEVTAILDWSNITWAEPAMDVAYTDVIMTIAGPVVAAIADVQQLKREYLDTYQSVRSLSLDTLDYYRAVRCAMALIEGAEGQGLWALPAVVTQLVEQIAATTGIQVIAP